MISEPGGLETLSIAATTPPRPGRCQVLIRVEFAGLNFTDVLARRGAPGYADGWPFVPGMEVAGIVEAIGEEVDGLRVGERAVAFTYNGGGLAEYAIADAVLTCSIPDELDSAQAATIPLTWATAIGLVRRSHIGDGGTALVTSATGGVGQALASLLARHGVTRVVAASRAGKTAVAGTVPIVRDDRLTARAIEANEGQRFDAVFESIGGDTLASTLDALAPGGVLISYGAAAGQPDPEPPRYRTLRGQNVAISGFSILAMARTEPAAVRDLISSVIRLTAKGLVIPDPHQVSWSGLIASHLDQSEGVLRGKTVLAVKAHAS